MWAHPRSRGENLRAALPHVARKRLIPAHAGKTLISFFEVRGAWAHPRSRGENEVPATTGLTLGGSSPLTRGKRWKGPEDLDKRRLIPAHAGKTRSEHRRSDYPGAHPRSRGENILVPSSSVNGKGSSPLTRGKQR